MKKTLITRSLLCVMASIALSNSLQAMNPFMIPQAEMIRLAQQAQQELAEIARQQAIRRDQRDREIYDIGERKAQAQARGDQVEAARLHARLEQLNRAANLEAKADNMVLGIADKGLNLGVDIIGDQILGEQKRAAELEKAKAQAEIGAAAGIVGGRDRIAAIKDFMGDRKKLAGVSGALALAALGIYAAKHGTQVLAKWIDAKIGKPMLVRESSRDSLWSSFKNALFNKKISSRINEVVVHAELKEQLDEIAKATQAARMSGESFTNVLLYGPPGTGKTMFAKALAHHAGLEYAMMSGSDFAQFKSGEDITELHKLFDWAEQSEKGLLVFIDEADAFLASRIHPSTSDQSKKLTNAFLSRVEKPSSNKIMFVFATNNPQIIDSAVFSRIGDKVEFKKPANAERLDILNLYLKKLVSGKKIKLAEDLSTNLTALVAQLDGAVGRDIEQCCVNMARTVRLAGAKVLTFEIAQKVVRRYMAELQKQNARA